MSTKGWRKNTSITRKVAEAPFDFQFLQAVRLLERSAVFEKESSQSNISSNPVARFTPPSSESLRFKTNQSLAFPASEIDDVQRIDKMSGTAQWEMVVNLMGLTGSMGVLPYHYTELILKRQKQKDETMEKFFDLFNHRTLSLFFQASVKYNLPLHYERNRLHYASKNQHEPQTTALLSLIGLGTSSLNNRLYTKDESLIFYSGLLSQKVRTASGLKQILRSHFNIPVEIDQFVGQWQELIDDVRTKLPDFNNPTGRNVCLGRSAMLGKKGWFAQGKIHIILGPLNKKQLATFAPGTSALKALNELVRMYVGMENDYEFIIRIKKTDIPDKIQLGKKEPAIIGWNTWLSNKPADFEDRNKTLDISVSASRLG
ncbi:MAG: type VI secretion system baseplate subunit TssG [endosymbiont of Galathealinum brachiosum]|uniref:Type VI secretion system baseplate subunit TssG n=1 Tax=endosymbiont of Galathealinum brachiosum TaxID=2200906 RepID=A0A370DI54_9GAMM|nr:MAG: type VI secretion system baseplate subunit TssG [endosymbiont of Galathealinum brachiosum]